MMARQRVQIIIGLGVLCWLCLAGCERETTTEPSLPSASNFLPTPPKLQEVGAHLVGPTVYTVDARSKEIWMYFDFSRGSVVAVQAPKIDDWDLAFRRHAIRTNGGDTNPAGQSALLGIEDEDFIAVTHVPKNVAFVSDNRAKKRLHATNPVVEKWYHYSYTTNILAPKSVVYIVRTQDGKYAKMRILSYYCKDQVAGCLTFEYVYQGDGSMDLAAPPTQVSHLY